MAAYMIVQIDVQDAQKFDSYRSMVPSTLEPFGGRYIVRGGDAETLEGNWAPARIVVIEFPDRDKAKEWLESDIYSEARALRHAAAHSEAIVVDGVG
ncbi:MAG: DUF1330 domain-containing protein [Gammaproteobacteria bacterium]|nr:DUF1330 domain-containing protein [Gammaproteobacteria bacterium]